MSFAGVPLKQPFQVLRSSDWNLLVQAVDQVYLMALLNNQYMFQGVMSPYFASLTVADGAQFGGEIYVEGYKVLHDLDPLYIASFLSDALNQIYNYISVYLIELSNQVQQVQSTLQQVQSTVNNINVYVSPSALESFVLPVLSSATPLVSSSTPIKRAYLYVTNDTAYVVYVGGPSGQHFPIFPGTQLTIDVCDAIQIYLRSENYSYVRVLLELTKQSTCT